MYRFITYQTFPLRTAQEKPEVEGGKVVNLIGQRKCTVVTC